jgi:hypothetical protein
MATEGWTPGCLEVLSEVLAERHRQVAQYGLNDECLDGTGPEVLWLEKTDVNLDLRDATEIEDAFRIQYERYCRAHGGVPTWMLLVREEIAEAFKESDPERLTAELVQVAALCVSWVEAIRRREQ